MNTKEAADKLSTSVDAVQKLIQRGSLKAVRVGGEWQIEEAALVDVRSRKRGRPVLSYGVPPEEDEPDVPAPVVPIRPGLEVDGAAPEPVVRTELRAITEKDEAAALKAIEQLSGTPNHLMVARKLGWHSYFALRVCRQLTQTNKVRAMHVAERDTGLVRQGSRP